MDDFTPYGYDFYKDLSNIFKVLTKYIEMHLPLSLENCEFLKNVGIVFGHAIS